MYISVKILTFRYASTALSFKANNIKLDSFGLLLAHSAMLEGFFFLVFLCVSEHFESIETLIFLKNFHES